MIKLGHTLFALPFAMFGMCLAKIDGGKVGISTFVWIALAFAGARSAAMGFNRIADAEIDAKNPRTSNRAIASGKISKLAAGVFVALSAALMLLSAAMLNKLCLWLALPALTVLFGYSYCKRFTAASHFVLGLALSMAPIGAWIAVKGSFDPRICLAGLALFFQISAFDILYALQDIDFDKKNGLFSVPAKFGKKASLAVAPILFAGAAASLFAAGFFFKLGAFYAACAAAAALVYFAGYAVFLRAGLNKINLVFFYMNAASSVIIMLSVLPKTFF